MGTKNNTSLIERHTSVAQNVTSSGVYVRTQCVCSPDKVECPHVGSMRVMAPDRYMIRGFM